VKRRASAPRRDTRRSRSSGAPKTASRRPFDLAIAEFAAAYADLNERNHKALVDSKIAAVGGV
jgi:hypothetical protein